MHFVFARVVAQLFVACRPDVGSDNGITFTLPIILVGVRSLDYGILGQVEQVLSICG